MNIVLLLILAMMWGPSYMFIKICVDEMSPFSVAAGRCLIGATVLLLVGRKLPKWGKTWGFLALNGLFACSLPFILFGFGEMRISSSLAGMINGITPIIAAVFSHLLIPTDRLTPRRILGVTIGIFGFCVLAIPPLFSQNLAMDVIGILIVGLAATSYAVGMILGKKYLAGVPSLACATGQLVISTLYLVPLALIFEPGIPSISSKALFSLIGLGLMGTATAYALYFYVLERTSVTFLALSNYLLPIFSVVLGSIVLGERITWTAYVSGGLILLGMIIINVQGDILPMKDLALRTVTGTTTS